MKRLIVGSLLLLATPFSVYAGPPIADPLTAVLGYKLFPDPPQSKDKDALKANRREIYYSCMNYPKVKDFVPDACIPQVEALKGILCEAGWTNSPNPKLAAYLDCLAGDSEGEFKSYYRDQARKMK
jgi:hypothetical protein